MFSSRPWCDSRVTACHPVWEKRRPYRRHSYCESGYGTMQTNKLATSLSSSSWGLFLFFATQVISGQQLPRPRGSAAKATVVDPYVLIQIYGIPIDCAGKWTTFFFKSNLSFKHCWMIMCGREENKDDSGWRWLSHIRRESRVPYPSSRNGPDPFHRIGRWVHRGRLYRPVHDSISLHQTR